MEPPADDEDHRTLEFVVVPRDEPSQRIPLAHYWALLAGKRKAMRRQLGQDLETTLLLNLRLAARMVRMLWDTGRGRSLRP